jgi:4-hydroxymandelate oxidase
MAPMDQLITIADYERAAAAAFTPGARAYFNGGAGDEITLRDNAAAWGRLAIHPRMLVGVGTRDPSVTVLGRERPHPLMVAPMAYQRLAHGEGEVATARGADAAGAVMCLSTLATTGVRALAREVPDATRWFQLYVYEDRGISRELVARAVDHGYEALIITVDLPVRGVRERELRVEAESVAAALGADPYAIGPGRDDLMTPGDVAALVDPTLSWSDVERIAADCPLPTIIKGILTPADARRALEHGARGVVVSNHGGRQLDTVLATADALPPIVDAVGGQLELFVDGGIRRGTDVLKALALGARAVLVGRPALWGLALAGADGVQRVLQLLLSEFDAALALAGVPRARDLEPTLLGAAPWA